jgi:transposase
MRGWGSTSWAMTGSARWSWHGGFPLEVHLFEGNKAETATLIPVLSAFAQRHGVRDMVVVADAGMLSAANLNALEDAGFGFIVGSRITKAPYDLAEHFERHGSYESGQSTGAGPLYLCSRR